MGYQIFDIGGGCEEIRCTSGISAHIRKQDGIWTVDEDDRKERFPNHGAALDRAREIAKDPDLR